MKNKYLIISLIDASILFISTRSFADMRTYVWTYEYKTEEKGKAELEYYHTLSSSDIGELQGNTSSEHQVELVLLMWAIAIWFVWLIRQEQGYYVLR